MGTAFKVYITDIYLPHIENDSLAMLEIKIVVKILRYHGNKKSTISGYTLHVLWKAVYQILSATVHFNSIYLFEIIHIKSSNANKKFFVLNFRYHGYPNVRRSTSTYETIFKGKVSSFSKCVYEQLLQSLNKKNMRFQK